MEGVEEAAVVQCFGWYMRNVGPNATVACLIEMSVDDEQAITSESDAQSQQPFG